MVGSGPSKGISKGQAVVLTHECCFRYQARSFVSNKTQPNTQSKRGREKNHKPVVFGSLNFYADGIYRDLRYR